jgi:hypothetical protein
MATRKRSKSKDQPLDKTPVIESNGEPVAPSAAPETDVPAHDLYDPAFLGLSQDFAGLASVKKKWTTIKVEKPTNSRVFRVHHDSRFHLKTVLLSLKDDSEMYVVLPQLRSALSQEVTCGEFALLACVTKKGTPFIWPIKLADADGKWNEWHRSAWQIAQTAMTAWTRVTSNREAGYYESTHDEKPSAKQQPPIWPDMTWGEWLYLAFKDHTIDKLDHPVLRRLRLED